MSPEVQKIIMGIIDVAHHRAWILEANDEQLDEYILHISGHEQLHRTALAERERRQIKRLTKHHWTLLPTFGISLGILIAAVLTLIVAWLSWKYPNTPPTPNEKPSTSMTNSASRPLSLPPRKAATLQTSPPAFYRQPGTNIVETHSNYHAP